MQKADSPEFDDLNRYVVSYDEVAQRSDLTADRGWIDMDVRWMVTDKSVGARWTTMGRTTLRPGSKHDIHRHPHAEEWEYVISGHAVKHIGDGSVRMRPGDVVYVPPNVYHGLENASQTEVLHTVWGYGGVASLEDAGYILPSDDDAQ